MNSDASHSRLSARTLLEAGGAFAGGAFLAGAYFGVVGAVLGSLAGFVVVLATSSNVSAEGRLAGVSPNNSVPSRDDTRTVGR